MNSLTLLLAQGPLLLAPADGPPPIDDPQDERALPAPPSDLGFPVADLGGLRPFPRAQRLAVLPALELTGPSPADATPSRATSDSVWERLSFSANGRHRAEATFDRLDGEDRIRGRLRLRIQASYAIDEELTAGARLSTRSDGGDARSPYWDFGDGEAGFDAARIGLDRFFLTWRPETAVTAQFGKFEHAFTAPPIYGEYAWDADLNPAGVSAVWAPESNEGQARFDLRGAGYVAVENPGDSDPHMLGAQANGWFPIGKETELHAALSYSDWSSIGADGGRLPPSGNTPGNGGFAILEALTAVDVGGSTGNHTQAFLQLLRNVADDSGEDSGVAVGLWLGKRREPGDMAVFASAFDLEANSVYGPVAQDDTPLPGTGVGAGQSGWILGAEYLWRQNVVLKLWALTTDVGEDEDPFRVRLDLTFALR